MNGGQLIGLIIVAGCIGYLLRDQQQQEREARLDMAREFDRLSERLAKLGVELDEVRYAMPVKEVPASDAARTPVPA